MPFPLVKHRSPKSQGLVFVAIAHAGLGTATLLALALLNAETLRTAPVAALLLACLLFANAGLTACI